MRRRGFEWRAVGGPRLNGRAAQNDVELKLREAGIKVANNTDVIADGIIYITAQTCREAMSVSATLREQVRRIGRDSIEDGWAITWMSGQFGYVGQARIASSIREIIRDLATEFVNKWFADNVPDPPVKSKP